MAEQKAQLRYLMIAPRKVRLIANTIKNLSVSEAEAQLLLRPQRASEPLLKLLRSAIANAKNNAGLKAESLFVKAIMVNPAPVLKRSLPRSQGRATPLLHRMSHIVLVLAEGTPKPARFVIVEKEKKTKTEKEKAKAKGKPVDKEHTRPEKKEVSSKGGSSSGGKEAAPKKSTGAVKRLFNRKSV